MYEHFQDTQDMAFKKKVILAVLTIALNIELIY